MADGDNVIQCPLCGNTVPPGVKKCPICATVLRDASPSIDREGLGPPRIDDYLHKEIPKVDLPTTKMACPLCGRSLDGCELKCPRCGTPLVGGNEMLECPECGALSPPGARSCSKCGIGFDSSQVVPPLAPIPIAPPPRPVRPESGPAPVVPPAPQARSPEVTTMGPSPASSRQGFVNGRGAVNGTGLVNGTGMTNGTRLDERTLPSRAARGRGSFISRWQFLAVVVAVIVVVPTFIFISFVNNPSEPIEIGGGFGDWEHVAMFGMSSSTPAPSIDVDQWGIVTHGSVLYLYVKVQQGIMTSTGVDSFYLFIDMDSSAGTGYAVQDIGADYLLEADGWNGTIQSTAISRYNSAAPDINWNSWQSLGSLATHAEGNQMECRAEMPESVPGTAKLVLMSENSFEQKAVSYSVPAQGGLLVVTQEVNSANAPNGIVASSTSVQLLRLHLRAEGAGGKVTGIAPSLAGAKAGAPVGELSLAEGEERTVDIAVDTSSCLNGTLVTASVVPSGVTSDFASVMVQGAPAMVYARAAPMGIVIDGAFGDWTGRTTPDADSIPPANADIDITATGAVNTTASSSFYVSVRGSICNGTYVPALKMRPSGGGGGGGTVLTRLTGEDVLKIYVDSDLNASTGQAVTGAGKTIGADRLIEVHGIYGKIVGTSMKTYAGDWSSIQVAVLAANDESRLELSVPAASLGGSSDIDFIIVTTDWRGRGDQATAVPQGSASGLSVGILSWPISSTTSTTATAMSYQRKIFHDGTNFWSFYSDGANTVCRWSLDGSSWSSSAQVFSNVGVLDASIWYDPANQTVYAVGDRSTASRNAYVQKGTVAPAAHTITWAAGDTALAVSTINLGSKNAFISRDASGYLWILSSNCTQIAPSYDLSAFKSSAINSIVAWTFSGNMLGAAPSAQPNVQGSILPCGTGSDMWAVYGYSGNVASRRYSGTWAAQQVIFASGGPMGQTDLAPPCAVVGAGGVLHVLFGDDHEKPAFNPMPHVGYAYNTGAGWSVVNYIAGKPNNEGFVYPTISIESSSGTLYGFWIRVSDQAIVGMSSPGGASPWAALALGVQTAFAKQYLTSVYSATGQQFVCWQWTQNTSAPIEVQYDRLPEFGRLSMPAMIVCMLAAVIWISRRRVKRA